MVCQTYAQRPGIAAGGILEFRLPGTDAKLKNYS